MTTIIIITGDLAAGKTSYGKKISNELKIPFFSKDEIKEVLYDSMNNNDTDYESKRKIGKIAMIYFTILLNNI